LAIALWIYAFYLIFFQDHAHPGEVKGVANYALAKTYKTAPVTMDLSGKLSLFQDHSPILIYAAFVTHGIAGVLIVVYGFVIKRIPVRFMYSWQAVCWFFVWVTMLSCTDDTTARWLEEVGGRVLPYVIVLILGTLVYIFLYGLSLLSCFGCSGRSRRYLPVQVVPNAADEDDDDCIVTRLL
jgi:hypothetical protein